MLATYPVRSWLRFRRFVPSLLLLLVPACGLSDYEALMRETQVREQHFRDENKYLDEPVEIAKRKVKNDKDKKEVEVPVANVFFRPPKGIRAKPEAEPRNGLMWRYPAAAGGSDFVRVEMAFTTDNKEFATDVFRNYEAAEQPRIRVQEFTPPGGGAPLTYDIQEFYNGPEDHREYYAVSILRSAPPRETPPGTPSPPPPTRVAIVYVYSKKQDDSIRKAIDLSLESLAVDQQANVARQRYARKSPWQLQPTPAP